MESINYLGWESNLSIRPPRSFKYCLEVSLDTNQWERLSWKTKYSMILTNNNTNRVSSQLFGYDRAKFRPLGRRHLHHLMFITELLLVWPVGHMDPNITDWATNPSQMPWNCNLPTWMWCYSSEPFIIFPVVCNRVTEEWRETLDELAKEGGSFWNNM